MLSKVINVKVVGLFAAFLLLGVGVASAQLSDDPRQVPLPDRMFNEPSRAVVVSPFRTRRRRHERVILPEPPAIGFTSLI